jgi:hypothetical protein
VEYLDRTSIDFVMIEVNVIGIAILFVLMFGAANQLSFENTATFASNK